MNTGRVEAAVLAALGTVAAPFGVWAVHDAVCGVPDAGAAAVSLGMFTVVMYAFAALLWPGD
jgi:hypothetical protein